MFAADSVRLSLFKFSWWAPKTHVFRNTVRNGRSRSSTVVDFGTNHMQLPISRQYIDPVLPRFRDIAGFLLRTATPLLFDPNFGGVPTGLSNVCNAFNCQ